jgi:outer membrane protein assembly factor BamE (lipoprotein component of BamABCDE complex)
MLQLSIESSEPLIVQRKSFGTTVAIQMTQDESSNESKISDENIAVCFLREVIMKHSVIARGLLALTAILALTGCMSAHQHYQQTHGAQERQMTVGIVQKEIRKSMSAAEVAEVLGSPNIVTTDSEGREVWVYDKISTDVTYSRDSGGLGAILLIGSASGGTAGGGLGSGSYNRSAGAQSETQRTLTVVIKFDEQKKVRDFAYHASRF